VQYIDKVRNCTSKYTQDTNLLSPAWFSELVCENSLPVDGVLEKNYRQEEQ